MGLEDFGVILRPTQPISASSAEYALRGHGFAVSGSPALPLQSSYRLSDDAKNIEALIQRSSDNEEMLSYLSIRYAICQPEAATQAFLDVVTQLTGKFCFQIGGAAPGAEFSCETLGDFQEFTRHKVAAAKSRWSGLFAGDTEEVVLSVADSWKYFIAKHPKALRSEPLLVR